MYCSSCGSALSTNLVYCNRCGAKVVGLETSKAGWSPYSIVWAMVSLFVGGLGVVTALITVLNRVFRDNVGLIIAFTLLSFLVLILMEAILAWLVMGSKRQAAANIQPEQLRELQAKALSEGHFDRVPTVTEHTTRTFEPIHTQRE